MQDVTLVGIDLGKHSFHLNGQDRCGKAVFRKKVGRKQLLEFFAKFHACTVVMEACGASTCTTSSLSNDRNAWTYDKGPLITTTVSGGATRLLINGKPYESGSHVIEINQPIEVQLVRDNRVMRTGSFDQDSFYFGIRNLYTDDNWPVGVYLKGEIKTIDGTCSVPAQSVMLPNASLHKFGGVGSTVGAHSFQIKINNCPKGYNQIGYTLDPVGGVIAGSPGVLPLAADSTASGVKIRIADSDGVPAAFEKSVKVDAYDTETGGSYSIPMQASYIQTDATIKPGTVNGAMTVLLDYQ